MVRPFCCKKVTGSCLLFLIAVLGLFITSDAIGAAFEDTASGTGATHLEALEQAIAKIESDAVARKAFDTRWDQMQNRRIGCQKVADAYVCTASATSELSMRVNRGQLIDPYRHPWQVALVDRSSSDKLLCGAVRIRTRWLLTACHCVTGDMPSAAVRVLPVSTYAWKIRFARAGEYPSRPATRSEKDAGNYPGLLLEIAEIVIHPEYDSSITLNDIALIRLAGISAADHPLIDIFPNSLLHEGEPLKVSGWGRLSEEGSLSQTLQMAVVPYVGTERCMAPETYGNKIRPGMLCAGFKDGGPDACQGDSGGPLWYDADVPFWSASSPGAKDADARENMASTLTWITT